MASLGDVLKARRRRGQRSLLVYLMAGSVPDDRYLEVVETLAASGVHGLEMGFPFSDPMAEGPVIQNAATLALSRGMRWGPFLGLLRECSRKLPTAVMTYMNPIEQRGVARAMEEIASAGGTGLILPDLPVEAALPYRKAGRAAGVDTILLASPASPPQRLRRLVRSTSGFLYLVSRYGTTGISGGTLPSARYQTAPLGPLLREAHEFRPRLPVLVGFGVQSPEDVQRHLTEGADGVVVGSAVQKRISEGASPEEIGAFVQSLLPPGSPPV